MSVVVPVARPISLAVAEAITSGVKDAVPTEELWTPAELSSSDLRLWLDPSDTATISATGALVDQVDDKSGNANHGTSVTTLRPDTGTRSINGLNVLDFEPTAPEILIVADSATLQLGTGNFSVFAVFEPDNVNRGAAAQNTIFSKSSTAGIEGSIYQSAMISYIANDATLNQGAATANATPFLYSLFRNGSSQQQNINGGVSDTTSSATGNVSAIGTDFLLGLRPGTGPALACDGKIGEVILVAGYSATTFQKIEGYLAWKWGLQANLPSGHPYEFAAPTITPAPVPVDDNFANVSLLLHMDGADGSTTFTDSSSNAVTVTAVGNAQIDTAQSKFGGASTLFDGSGDYLQTPNNTEQIIDYTQPFTIECFVRVAGGSDRTIFDTRISTGSNGGGILFYYMHSGTSIACVAWGLSATALSISTSAISLNTWYHVAFVRESGGLCSIYIDGVLGASATESVAIHNNSSPVRIGMSNYTPSLRPYSGHIDELRVTKGVARYTAAFTPPTAPFPDVGPPVPVDDNFANVSLLLHMDGADGSTTFTDSSSNALTVTAVGNAQVDTAQSKFGGASGLFDGSGDYVSLPSGALLDMGSGDFTIDLFFRSATSAVSQTLVNLSETGTAGFAGIRIQASTLGRMTLLMSSSGSAWVLTPNSANGLWSINTWHHIALVRSGTSFKMYLDGAEVISETSSATIYSAGSSYSIGSLVTSSGKLPFNGHIDELRVTKGVARYTAAFTPPTAPFPDQGPEEEDVKQTIQTITLASAGEFDFNLIPGTYKRLIIEGQIRSSGTGTADNALIFFNEDLAVANYHEQDFGSLNGAPFAFEVTGSARIGYVPASGADTGRYASNRIAIESYSGPNVKLARNDIFSNYESLGSLAGGFAVRSSITAAITRIRIRTDNHPTDGFIGELTLYGEL